jgi:hypothetical protein
LIKTQIVSKEVVSYEKVEQIVSVDISDSGGSSIVVTSNSAEDSDTSLLNAKYSLYDLEKIYIKIEEDETAVIGLTAKQTLELGESLVSMANFLLDQSKYTEAK